MCIICSDDVHGKNGETPVQRSSYEGMSDIFVKAGIEKGWLKTDLNGRNTEGIIKNRIEKFSIKTYS